jgi:hypothetical protein
VFVGDVHQRLIARVGEPEAADVVLDALSAGERALYVLLAAADQIARGGFEQFFYFLPHLAAEAAAAAERVKARAFRPLFEQANEVAVAEPPRKRAQSEFRRMMRAVESASHQLATLDDEFDALMADPNTRIEASLVMYMRATPAEFAALDS